MLFTVHMIFTIQADCSYFSSGAMQIKPRLKLVIIVQKTLSSLPAEKQKQASLSQRDVNYMHESEVTTMAIRIQNGNHFVDGSCLFISVRA